VLCIPLGARVPLQPPDAVHALAFAELQLKTAALPAATTVGLAASAAVGTTLTVTLTGLLVPPAPVQVSGYVVLMETAVDAWPLAAFAPLHPPDASQEVAFDELHVNVAELPAATTSGFTLRVAVGTALTVALAGALTAGTGAVDAPSPPPQDANSSAPAPSHRE